MTRSKIREPLPRRILQKLPAAWRAELVGAAAEAVTSGMSGAAVFRLRTEPVCFLKFAESDGAETLRHEITRTAWLADRGIRVAPILRSHDDGKAVAMQTQALPGMPADRRDWPKTRLLPALGRALAALHALPIADCPFDESLTMRLAQARQAVARGDVDARQFASRNRGVTPQAILARITTNAPPEDFVVAHGDASLSNMIVAADGAVGLIDCGHAGRADRYLDLAVIAAEIEEYFGRHSVRIFADAYGERRWNTGKAAFYADLYELF
jgi:aminoglycoside 3'-phosphotransferase-2